MELLIIFLFLLSYIVFLVSCLGLCLFYLGCGKKAQVDNDDGTAHVEKILDEEEEEPICPKHTHCSTPEMVIDEEKEEVCNPKHKHHSTPEMIMVPSGHPVGNIVPLRIQPPQHHQPDTPQSSNQFENVTIQPACKDILAEESVLAGSVSLPTVIPDAPTEDLGMLLYFNISYDNYIQLLKVFIERAEGLPTNKDPYVKVFLNSEKTQHTTKVKKKKMNPTWNECFSFEQLSYEDLMVKKLYLQVFDFDYFSKNDVIGDIELPLAHVNLQVDPVEFVQELHPSSKHSSIRHGDLLISLCFEPNAGNLIVIIMKCNELKPVDGVHTNPYVKVELVVHGKKTSKKKTKVKKNCLDPVWNEVMVFQVASQKMSDVQCTFNIMHSGKHLPLGKHLSSRTIGRVVIGPNTSGRSMKHWKLMMHSPKKPVAMWHTIIVN